MQDESARKSIELYELMAKRCASRGLSPHQAQIYTEMVNFMQEYDSAASMAHAIKYSKYYLAPSAAIVQDRAYALAKAARECGMDDVAEIYEAKISEIDEDIASMYDSSFETKALNASVPYANTREAFVQAYIAYITLSCAQDNDSMTLNDARKQITCAMNAFEKPSSDFTTLANLPEFRALIPATNEGYARFVERAPLYVQEKTCEPLSTYSASQTTLSQDIQENWSQAKASKDKILAVGQSWCKQVKKGRVRAQAPHDAAGHYSYNELL